MNGLALCSGFGGIERGLESRIDGFKTVCHVEGEAYSVANLIKKMENGEVFSAPIWSNVQTFDGSIWRGKVDIITGGFPCQPHSIAGKLLVEKDSRNLWPDVKRIISEVSPSFLFLENVSNINNTIGSKIVGELAQMGFECAWCVVRASDVGAPHRRARWFLFGVADSNGGTFTKPSRTNRELLGESERLRRRKDEGETRQKLGGSSKNDVTDSDYGDESNMRFNESFKGTSKLEEVTITNSDRERIGEGRFLLERTNGELISGSSEERGFEEWWAVEPTVGRMVDGVAHWVDRLRGLGNGVVPQQAAYAFDILSTAIFNQRRSD